MDPVSNLSQLVETLRRQLSPRLDQSAIAKPGVKNKLASPHHSQPAAVGELQATLAHRIKAINPDDKRRTHKATRIFLETVLSNEFGDVLLNDPRFGELIEEIQATMEADEELQSKLEALILQLSQ